MKYIKQFLKYFEAFPAFTSKDVKLFLRKNGANEGYYKIFMHDMVKSGRAFGIRKGSYTLHDDPMFAGFIFSPFYYGLETALTYHKLWEYVTPITIITTRRVDDVKIKLLERNASVRRIQRKNFFGYSMVKYGNDLYVPIADVEKTFIDSVYFHDYFNKVVCSKIAKKVNIKRLHEYLKSYSDIVKKQVNDRLKNALKP